MKQQTTKSRKMLVKLTDSQGNIFSKIFNIEIPSQFNQSSFNTERIEVAMDFHKPYPGALSKLAQNLVSSQILELEKAQILAEATLDKKVKCRFISDYNLATSTRLLALRNLHPKAKAYRAEKGLDEVSLSRFVNDFLPMDMDTEGKKQNPFKYVTIEKDDTVSIEAVKLEEAETEAVQAVE